MSAYLRRVCVCSTQYTQLKSNQGWLSTCHLYNGFGNGNFFMDIDISLLKAAAMEQMGNLI